jgi:hypothetical protein
VADVQILRAPTTAVPSNYTLPDAAELRLKAVYAEFDGSGAAGSFLPCVTLISDSGDVIGRAVDPSSPVAAGGSADVTFFPGVKTGGGQAFGLQDYLVLQGVAQNILDPPVGDSDHAKFNAATAQSNDLGSWTFVLDGGGRVKEVDTTVSGRYVSVCQFSWGDPVAATDLTVVANMFGAGPLTMSPDWRVSQETEERDGFTQAFSNLPSGTLQMTIEPDISNGDALLGFVAVYWWILRFPA